MPRLLVEKGPDRGKAVSVVAGKQVVAGRDKAADLTLSDQMASRRHFMIANKGSVFGLKDLNSANGTLVNGRLATSAHKLQYGDSIQVGETLLSWLPDEQTDTKGGLIGHMIGGYRIEERLGRGAMGTVYKATQLSLGRTVALKVLSPDLMKDEKFCEMFLKEARAAGGLNHSNIIQVYDVGDESDHYYFSMEFASKGSVLDELQTGGRIPLPRALRILRDACSALDYAERKGLVHRDIKPDNLMVTEDDSVKLGDLGLAMSTVELQGEQDGVFGTPHYIAPEQAMGKPIDHRADIYGLGATLYRMLTGKTLFQGTTVKEILKKQVREPHPPITDHLPDCPPAIQKLIDRMLAKNPAERYQHASEILSDLSDYENLSSRMGTIEGTAMSVRPRGFSPEQSQEIAKRRARSSLLIAAVVAVVAVAAAVVSITWVLRGDPPPPIDNNDTIAGNTNAGNNTGNQSNKGGGGTTVPPEVQRANEALRTALANANFLVSRDGAGLVQFREAHELLDEALRRNPRADEELRTRIEGRMQEVWALVLMAEEGEVAVQEEWEDVFRRAGELVEGFKFNAAKDLVAEFIAKHSDKPDEGVQNALRGARSYVDSTWATRTTNRMTNFEAEINRRRNSIQEHPIGLQVSMTEQLLKDIQTAAEACDEETQKTRLEQLATTTESRLALLRQQADRDAREAVLNALSETRASLHALLVASGEDVALGRFASSMARLDAWQEQNEHFRNFGTHELFQPVRDDLLRRREQTKLIYDGIRALADNGGRAMATLPELTALLMTHPWPQQVAALLGDSTVVRIRVDSSMSDAAWELQVGTRSMPASELNTPGKREAFAHMLAHLVSQQHATSTVMRERLAQPLSSGVPVSAAVFAWLADMNVPEHAIPFIDHAWENAPEADPGRKLVREYYAWGLLAQSEVARRAGNASRANDLIRRVRNEFGDTRAARQE